MYRLVPRHEIASGMAARCLYRQIYSGFRPTRFATSA